MDKARLKTKFNRSANAVCHPRRALLVLLLGSGAPLQAQTLMDLTTAGAAQGALNSIAMPQYGGALSAARAAASRNQSTSLVPGAPTGIGLANGAASVDFAPVATPPLGTQLPQVNGRLIGTCSSGQLCLSQIRSAMGLR